MKNLAARIAALSLFLNGCDGSPVEPPLTRLPRELSVAEAGLVAADNRFTFDLLRATLETDSQTNVFISPLSASVALGMTLNGAAGATADSMRAVLGFGGLSLADINAGYRGLIDLLSGLDRSVTWELANSVWYRQDYVLRSSFLDATRTFFDAQVAPLDFASPGAGPTINQWVTDRTHGRITNIVPDQLPADAIMYLINAIYFKGSWTTRFDAARTKLGPFRTSGGATVQVPMMFADEVPLRLGFRGGVQVVELPYARGAYALTIVLPPEGSLDSLAHTVTRDDWDAWLASLHAESAPLTMPKVTIRYGLRFDDALRSLGMRNAFCDAHPDFTAMDPTGRACIFEVRHQAFVQVDEAGTEAAAVTSVGVIDTSAPMVVAIDRPFLFAIRERLSGMILFVGVVRDPSAGLSRAPAQR